MPSGNNVKGQIVPEKPKLILLSSNLVLLWIGFSATIVSGQATVKPFTVADDIGIRIFWPGEQVVWFSPDQRYLAISSERGMVDVNRVENSIRFYRSRDIQSLLNHSESSRLPEPVWILSRTAYSGEDKIIQNWRWLADSTGVAFLEQKEDGSKVLMLADIRRKNVDALTPQRETVEAFDIRDRRHYVFLSAVPDPPKKEQVAIPGTDVSIEKLLFPKNPIALSNYSSYKRHLWAVVDGKRFEVKRDGGPFLPELSFALSPDGKYLVTALSFPDAPAAWETLYPPPPGADSSRKPVLAGKAIHQYARLDLRTGAVDNITHAPIGRDVGYWWGEGEPRWSDDGKSVLLPNTFLKGEGNSLYPCAAAVVEIISSVSSCIEMLKHPDETDYRHVMDVRFSDISGRRVAIVFWDSDKIFRTKEYEHGASNTWQSTDEHEGYFRPKAEQIEVVIKQGLNDPPQFLASNGTVSRMIWNPNPQLKEFHLGQVSSYTWNDKEGRTWTGGLYKPIGYTPGQRYPLVIQTHGFAPDTFLPSGAYPTGYAASELAAIGIVVLQVPGCPARAMGSPAEGLCYIAGFESAAKQLISEGLVDAERIGIVGFSRSCFHVIEELAFGSLRLRAASITDGVMATYSDYINGEGTGNNGSNSMIGTHPFGEGLQVWLKRSPGFNLDRIKAPVLVVAEGQRTLLGMWEPYAGLHALKKPVDLIMLNTDDHVLTNPALRLASQGGSVDWFRFWLKGYEDPDPSKADQYKRWRGLAQMQRENEAKEKAANN